MGGPAGDAAPELRMAALDLARGKPQWKGGQSANDAEDGARNDHWPGISRHFLLLPTAFSRFAFSGFSGAPPAAAFLAGLAGVSSALLFDFAGGLAC